MSPTPPAYHLRSFSTTLPLLAREPEPMPPRQRVTSAGVPGDFEEMIPVFGACLQVGKLNRAAMVLTRLGTMNMDFVGGDDLVDLHHRYLRAEIKQMMANSDYSKAQDLHKWYELQIRGPALPQNTETIALMLKVSLLASRGAHLERLVNRYMGMVSGDVGLEVLSMSGILTDQDLGIITGICDSYNLDSPFFEAHEALPEVATTPEFTTAQLPTDRQGSAEEILVTPQKGLGLLSLKQNLSLFSEIPGGGDIATLPYEQRREIQSRLEKDSVDAAVDRWEEEHEALIKMGLNPSMAAPHMKYQVFKWYEKVEARLKAEFVKIDAMDETDSTSRDPELGVYGPFLRLSTPSRLAAITIISILNTLAMRGVDKGAAVSQVISNLAKAVEEDVRAQTSSHEKHPKLKRASRVYYSQGPKKAEKELQAKQAAQTSPTANKSVASFDPKAFPDKSWPVSIKTRVGATLLSALIESAKIAVAKPHPVTGEMVERLQAAFSHNTHFKKGKRIGVLLPNPEVVVAMTRQPRAEFLASHLPMVVEPEPWSRFDKGGYLEYQTSLVRMKNHEKDQRIYADAAIARGDMEQVFKGLDILGQTAWRINPKVLRTMLEAWNTGEAIADIPSLHPEIPIPPEPDSTEDPMLRRKWIRAVKAAENERSGLHSVRCFMNLQLEIARAYRDQTFYFPHNVDFRGRAYPVPEYLNHMGADHVRGLLQFARGKELGEHGLRWLKIHLANVYGYDKASLSERESFATDNLANVLDSAENPMTGNKWWLKAEDPWQCLAACCELKAATESPDPTRFVSHLPIHQDGTCNGLQHYAALGGDTYGARQVNLEPGDRPADVYSGVADLVKQLLAEDVAAGNPLAKAMEGKITRKVVKQTVMTSVYGVTFVGAKRQILRQIEAAYPEIEKETGLNSFLLASYTTTKVFKALSTMFRGAHDIQFWLGECGNRACRALTAEQIERIAEENVAPTKGKRTRSAKSKPKWSSSDSKKDTFLDNFRSTVIWTTPLRMPVVQPYRKSGNRRIKTVLQELQLNSPQRVDPVNRRKQLQALPPNFIHSLDASHMLLTAIECDARGLVFAAVHDSFWTHASDIDSLNGVIRDSFVRIHTEDVIGRLLAEFEARYKGAMYLAKIDKRTPTAKKILQWRKENRLSIKDELLLERRRSQLAASDDREDVEAAAKITTPATIYESLPPADSDVDPEGLDPIFPTEPEPEIEAVAEAEEAAQDESAEDIEASENGIDGLASMIGTRHFDINVSQPKPKAKPVKPTIQIWLPMSFPPVPKKGDFDVNRLKSSQYFFS